MGDAYFMNAKALLVLLLFMLSFGAGEVLAAGFQDVDPASAARLIQQRGDDLVIIDVRTVEEYFQARIENAKLLSIHQPEPVYWQRLESLPRDKAYLLYCTVGERSKRVASDMARLGFPEVYNLEKGIMDWYKQRYPIIQGAP